MDDFIFGLYVKDKRERLGLSAKDVSDGLYISRSTLSNIENGKREMTKEERQRFLDFFGVEYGEDETLKSEIGDDVVRLFEYHIYNAKHRIANLTNKYEKWADYYLDSNAFALYHFFECVSSFQNYTEFVERFMSLEKYKDTFEGDVLGLYLYLDSILTNDKYKIQNNYKVAMHCCGEDQNFLKSMFGFMMLYKNVGGISFVKRREYIASMRSHIQKANNYYALFLSDYYEDEMLAMQENSIEVSEHLFRMKWFIEEQLKNESQIIKEVLIYINELIVLSLLEQKEYQKCQQFYEEDPVDSRGILALLKKYLDFMSGNEVLETDIEVIEIYEPIKEIIENYISGDKITKKMYDDAEMTNKSMTLSAFIDQLYINYLDKNNKTKELIRMYKKVNEKYIVTSKCQ